MTNNFFEMKFTTVEKKMLCECFCGHIAYRTVFYKDSHPSIIHPKEKCENCGARCLVEEVKD